MKTLIAIPCMDMVPLPFFTSFVGLHKPDGTNWAPLSNCLIYDSRNIFSSGAIDNGYDRVLWLDSDMRFDPDLLDRLSADMDENPDRKVISALYFKRKTPTSPVIYKKLEYGRADDNTIKPTVETYHDYPKEALFPVAGCGFGAVLTSVDILRDVWDAFGPPFDPMTHMGEDLAFCWRVNQIGEQIYCDSRVKCGHVGLSEFNEFIYKTQTRLTDTEGR